MGRKRRGKRDVGSARAAFCGLGLILPWCLSAVVCAQASGPAETLYPAPDPVEQTLVMHGSLSGSMAGCVGEQVCGHHPQGRQYVRA